MNAIKFKNGHYLDDEYTSVELDTLWNKLVSYIKNNASAFSNIYYNKHENYIKVNYLNEGQFLDLIKKVDPNFILKKNIIRTTKLKLRFNHDSKSLEIVDDPNSNEIYYSTCNNRINAKGAIYFNEESVEDYTNDYDCDQYLNCNYVIARFTYDVNASIMNNTTSDIKNLSNSEDVFLCYNLNTNKLENDLYLDTMNKNKSIDVEKLIDAFNNNSYDQILSRQISDADFEKMYQFSNIKYSISEFKMIDKSEIEFMNFKAFASRKMYENFIEKMERKAITVGE